MLVQGCCQKRWLMNPVRPLNFEKRDAVVTELHFKKLLLAGFVPDFAQRYRRIRVFQIRFSK
jgi:hypothetical protein